MKTLIYLHGLGSSAASRKFVCLKEVFGSKYNVVCPEWTYKISIRVMLGNLYRQYENEKSIIIIGSSTGGNFAYQLREKLRLDGVKVKLILINPLLHLEQRTSQRTFPSNLVGYMSEIKEVKDCSLILSNEDEAIDHSLISRGENVKAINIDDNHRIKNVMKLMSIIERIIKKKRSRKKDSVVVKITIS